MLPALAVKPPASTYNPVSCPVNAVVFNRDNAVNLLDLRILTAPQYIRAGQRFETLAKCPGLFYHRAMTAQRTKTWFTILPAMVLPCIASLFYFVLFSEKLFAQLLYAGTKLFTVLWPALAVFLVLGHPFPKINIAWRKHLKALPLGIISGIIIVAGMFALMQTPLGEIARASGDNIRQKLTGLGILEHYWLFSLFLAIAHSLIEEYYWRWFLFGRLRSVIPVFWAHILAGAAFASHHVVIASQFFGIGWGFFVGAAVAAGGIIWSIMYNRQRTLVGSWASHMIVDLGIEVIGHSILFGTFF